MRRAAEDDGASLTHRWMLTWSDFVTLLLAVFAVMYAQAKQQAYWEHAERVSHQAVLPVSKVTMQPDISEPGGVAVLAAELEQALLPGQGGKVSARVLTIPEGVLLELDAKLLFSSGDARLTPELATVLERIAAVLRKNAYPVAIEGYADSAPISNARFPSNWELSATRAASVARLFAEQGIGEDRIEVTGRGTNLAVNDNATPEARRSNRRVRILIRVPGGAVAGQ